MGKDNGYNSPSELFLDPGVRDKLRQLIMPSNLNHH